MKIAIALFEQVTALDAIGPYEVLQRLPNAEVLFVGHRKGEVRTDNGFLGLNVDYTFDEVRSPEIFLVPGGVGTRALVHDDAILDWIRGAHETSDFSTSVCTGSLLLAAAGLLVGVGACGRILGVDEYTFGASDETGGVETGGSRVGGQGGDVGVGGRTGGSGGRATGAAAGAG